MNLGFQPIVPVSEIVRRTQPGLVHIDVPTGSGSGFVIDAEGYIITNAHVVQEHSTVTAKFVDGAEYTGTVVGKDEKIDLACIRIANAGPLSPPDRGRYFCAMLMTLISDGARSMIFKPKKSPLTRSHGLEEPVLDSCKFEGFIPNFGIYLPLSASHSCLWEIPTRFLLAKMCWPWVIPWRTYWAGRQPSLGE